MKMWHTILMLAAIAVVSCGVCITDSVAQTVEAVTQPMSIPEITIPETEDQLTAWRRWFNEHRDEIEAMPMPEGHELIGSRFPDESVQIHNVITGETWTRKWSDLAGPMSSFVPSGQGDISGRVGTDDSPLDNYSELYRITNPSSYPWRVCVKLFMTREGTWWMGSGMLIDPKHVMTAGHCVYNRDVSDWVDYVVVIPGYEYGDEPYGAAQSVSLMTWVEFINTGSVNYDMGIIELDRPIGAITGWHGYGYNNDDNWFYSPTWNNPSYPGGDCSPDSGEAMYNWYGTVDVVYTYTLQVNRLGCGGMSGCCAYAFVSGNRVVYANGAQQWATYHMQCRITENKFGSISTWISGHTPSTLDLVSMDCNASPSTIQAGLQLSLFDHLIHNYSSASWTGTVTANVYLSTNDLISTGDVLIGSGGVNFAWGPLSSVRVNWQEPPTIPVNTAQGNYYLGVIIDHADYNNANNSSSYDDAFPIHVDACPSISSITLSSPAAGDSICSGWDWTYRWRRTANASTYRIQWDSEPGFILPQEAVTTDTSIQHVLSGSGLRYWRVRGESACRDGNWSAVRSLTLLGTPATPALSTPVDGQVLCSGESNAFCWSPANNAVSYLIQWDDTLNFSSPEWELISSTCVSRTFGGTGIRYWRVRGQNDCSVGSWSATRTFELDPCLQPANDSCANAEEITIPGTFTGTTVEATIDDFPTNSNCDPAIGPGVWYKFAGHNQVIVMSIDADMAHYFTYFHDACCGRMSCLYQGTCGQSQSLGICVGSGVCTYYLLVSSCDPDGRPFTFTISEGNACTPNSCGWYEHVVNAPTTVSGTSCGTCNDCDLGQGEEITVRFAANTAGIYTLSSATDFPALMYVGTGYCAQDVYLSPNCGLSQSTGALDLPAGVYIVTVEPCDPQQCGAYTIGMLAGGISPPQNLVIQQISSASLQLNWEPPDSPVSGYNIYRAPTPDVAPIPRNLLTMTPDTFYLDPIPAGADDKFFYIVTSISP